MGLLSLASYTSARRGYDYYKGNLVLSVSKIEENEYEANVKGSLNEPYHVKINIKHPRKSHCNCPHAEGSRVICKHMIAVFFVSFPDEAEQFIKLIEDDERIEEERTLNRYIEIEKYVNSLSIDELRSVLISTLVESEEDEYDW